MSDISVQKTGSKIDLNYSDSIHTERLTFDIGEMSLPQVNALLRDAQSDPYINSIVPYLVGRMNEYFAAAARCSLGRLKTVEGLMVQQYFGSDQGFKSVTMEEAYLGCLDGRPAHFSWPDGAGGRATYKATSTKDLADLAVTLVPDKD